MATRKVNRKKVKKSVGIEKILVPMVIDQFTFHTFYHPHTKAFIKELNKQGIDGLLQRKLQQLGDSILFKNTYDPAISVTKPYPVGVVDFDYSGAYSLYNWELFFHVPMLIACRLSVDQRFDEARRWFHRIFDPTSSESGDKERFWQFKPFYDEALSPIKTLSDLLHNAAELSKQVDKWQKKPFRPHVIARMRINAYMKTVVLKYLDNLIAWGDQLFRRDTIESINEATNLYVLAWEILGEQPQRIPPRAIHAEKSFNDLKDSMDTFSQALVDIETFVASSGPAVSASGSSASLGKMFNFCVPRNENLLLYWDKVTDRLFKIRHSMNIEGITRALPLYEPPIDPALLVRAAAAGIDLSSILRDIQGELPNYRFTFMLQKTNELVNDLKSLGSSLLQALEKRDAEAIALLRSRHEQKILAATMQVKQFQAEDAKALLQSAEKSLESATARFKYYNTREFMNAGEKVHLASMQTGMLLSVAQGATNLIGGVLSAIPNLKIGALTSLGATFGGENLGTSMKHMSEYLGIIAGINSAQGAMASTVGGYLRRLDDWQFQAGTASIDMKQLEQQVISGQIKLAIAEKEVENHELQIENSKEMDETMRDKFTNEQLYDWMVGQISSVYFQSYQLAYDLAKKTERCYQYELGEFGKSSFIQFGYWDSLKKGLLSAEKLQYDLRRMEARFLDKNKRTFELTKSISIMLLDPGAVAALRRDGWCSFVIPEALFDLDFAGHYFRRIKTVSISIPCIAGPYTTISATLRLKAHTTRIDSSPNPNYESNNYQADTARFKYVGTETASIATSNAQNDGGIFELNFFRDERYLPFEGCGVISEWELSLNDDPDKFLRLFDYDTISDVILHIKYTALEDGALKPVVQNYLKTLITNTVSVTNPDPANAAFFQLWRGFSLRYDFSNEWYKMFQPALSPAKSSFIIDNNRFPYIAQNRKIQVKAIHFYALVKEDDDYTVSVGITTIASGVAAPAELMKPQAAILANTAGNVYHGSITGLAVEPGQFNIEINRTAPAIIKESDLKDLVLVLEYQFI